MAKAYFRKEVPNNPVRDSKGTVIPFQALNTSFGFTEIDADKHPDTVRELRAAIEAGRYGLSELDFEEYEAEFLKKKPSSTASLPYWLGGTGQIGRDEISGGKGGIAQDTLAPRRVDAAAADKKGVDKVDVKSEPAKTAEPPVDTRPPTAKRPPPVNEE